MNVLAVGLGAIGGAALMLGGSMLWAWNRRRHFPEACRKRCKKPFEHLVKMGRDL